MTWRDKFRPIIARQRGKRPPIARRKVQRVSRAEARAWLAKRQLPLFG